MIGRVSTIWDVSEMASPTASVIDVANPRRGDRAVAASFRAWHSEMDETGPIELPISACDELAAARADDDV